MEASLQDMTRANDRFGPLMGFYVFDPDALEVDIEVVADDTFADPWFAASDEVLAIDHEELPIEGRRGLHAILCFGVAVAFAALLHGATL